MWLDGDRAALRAYLQGERAGLVTSLYFRRAGFVRERAVLTDTLIAFFGTGASNRRRRGYPVLEPTLRFRRPRANAWAAQAQKTAGSALVLPLSPALPNPTRRGFFLRCGLG